MKRQKLKSISLWLTIMILVLMLAGCTDKLSIPTEAGDSAPYETGITQSPVSSLEETISEQPTASYEPQPLEYTWKAYAYSDIYRQVYGEEMERCYCAMVDAIMAGEQSVACSDEDTMCTLDSIIRASFPPYSELISGITFNDGEIHMDYSMDDERREQLLDQFKNQITLLIKSSGIMEGDTPEMIAIMLYHAYSEMISYDYDAVDDDMVVDVSSYRALMKLSGICQSFAPAYAYLCLQCGVDAAVTGGMTKSFESHEWTLLTLDGKYYYADTTFENGDGGMGLRYFGMTAAQRELQGGFIADEYNIGDTNVLWGCDLDVTDERFAPLWETVNEINIQREGDALHIQCERKDGTRFEFVVE